MNRRDESRLGSRAPARRLLFALSWLVCCAATGGAHAYGFDDAEAPRARAVVRRGPIVIDGRLDDPGWQDAPWHAGFTERKPGLGAAPPVETRFRVAFDRSFLYVAVFCGEPDPSKLVARSTTRDSFAIFNDDAISIKLDPLHDQRTTVGLVLNPVGARLDYRGVNERSMRREWDAIWTGAAQRVPGGWGAEFRVAWSVLGIDPDSAPPVLGLNFSRDHASRNATYDWALMPPPYTPITASRYGHLEGLEALAGLPAEVSATQQDGARDRGLLVLPWGLGGWNSAGEGRADGGIDVFAQRGRWRGQVTVNTDFAQADVDDAIVNLGRFSLRMPEKRDFFLRDMERFGFGDADGASAFYSRRIGLDAGRVVPILGGLKVTGDVGDRVRLAALDVATQSVTARDGQSALPAANATVLRGQVELGGGSNVGAIVTHRQSLQALRDANTVVGVDGALRGGRSPLLIEAFAMASHRGSDASRGTRDVGATAGSEAEGERFGGAAGVRATWRGRLVRPGLRYAWTGQGMRADLGFLPRVGVHETDAELVVEPRFQSYGLERLRLEAAGGAVLAEADGRLLDRNVSAGFDLVWNAGWLVGAEVERLSETVQTPVELIDVVVPTGVYPMNRWLIGFETPGVRAVSGWLDLEGRDLYGGQATIATCGLTLRPGTWLRLEAGGTLGRLTIADHRAWVGLVNARASIGFSPDLNLDLYGGYDHADHRVPWMARLRWTWRRGSDLFAVLQGQSTVDGATSWTALAKVTWALP
ncbi:MAG: hypothetical protein RIT45_1835 [Pseudomonadota bacterium]